MKLKNLIDMDLIIFIIQSVLEYTFTGIILLVIFIAIIENWPDARFNELRRAIHNLLKE